MKKITIIALHLGYGGIEKAIASFSNMLCDTYKIEIISTYKLYDKPAFKINRKVKIKYLMTEKPNKIEFMSLVKKGKLIGAFKEALYGLKVLYLKKKKMIEAIKEIDSDIIISTRPFHNKLLGKYSKEGILKIAWEHSHHNNNKKYINTLIKSCKNIDYLISVSKELNNFYKEQIDNNKTKCKNISLSIDYFPDTKSNLSKKEITAIGRLSKEKGFTDLIETFNLVHQNYPDWKLNIVGDGIEKDNIIEKINILGLKDSVIMHGYKNENEIHDILENTSIYVMTSLTESFGLVLIEAMSYGIPCLSFDSARGSLEIIDNNINGFIIKNRNMKRMASKIEDLIENKNLRRLLGKEALKKSLRYSKDRIKQDWIKVIEQEVSHGKNK
jgi:glycosyltransferase involved in cell wall biosynthesis